MSSLNYDRETALVVVDVQNDFADVNGNLYVSGGEDVIPIINSEIARARSAGARVVYTADWHPPSTPHFAKDGGIWPVHCVGDTWGAAFHPNLIVDGPVVRKGMGGEDGYSGFAMKDPEGDTVTETGLRDQLERWGIRRLVVCGLATDYCVRATALDGIATGYTVAVLDDAIRSVDLEAGDGDRAIAEMAAAGCLLDSAVDS
ncbi:MAG: isochorismatase family protein [Acidimicrobiia bacterium]|nr:isochorismatase family protein [Acidimicrobiia bacterium]